MLGVYTISVAMILMGESHYRCEREEVAALYHSVSAKASQSECILSRYRSKTDGNVHDITTDVLSILETAPFVEKITVSPAKKKVTRRIVHFANRNVSSCDTIMLKPEGELSDRRSRLMFEHFQEVAKIEMLQIEQMAALSALVHNNGLQYVFIDSYSKEVHDQRNYYISLLTQSQSAFVDKYGDVKSFCSVATNAMRTGSELSHFRDYQIYRKYLLEAGAVFRLLAEWKLNSSSEKLYPIPLIEDSDLKFLNSNSKHKGANREKLEDRFVKRLLTHDQDVVFLFMDGENNLSNNILAIDQNCEYIVVKLHSYRNYAEQPDPCNTKQCDNE